MFKLLKAIVSSFVDLTESNGVLMLAQIEGRAEVSYNKRTGDDDDDDNDDKSIADVDEVAPLLGCLLARRAMYGTCLH